MTFYENYYAGPDIVTISICMVLIVLIKTGYNVRSKSFFYYRLMVGCLVVSAWADLLFHVQISYITERPHLLIYATRTLYHSLLFFILFIYVMYFKNAIQLTLKKALPFMVVGTIIFFSMILYDIFGTVTKIGFHISKNNIVYVGLPLFPMFFSFFLLDIFLFLYAYRNRLYKQVVLGVIATGAISVLILIIQQIFEQSSYTASAFLFPLIALIYFNHSNPYDLNMGTVGVGAFEELVAYSHLKKDELYFMSLYMHDFEGKGRKYPKEIQKTVRHFATSFFKHPTLFQISGGHMILVIRKKKDPDYINGGQRMLEEFHKVYPVYNIDYKIVFTDTNSKLSEYNDYIDYIKYLHEKMPENTVLITQNADMDDYGRYKYILSQLKDIDSKKDLDDERVLVYCQPVLNIRTNKYDTAEALMRLSLPDTGMVFPDQFIPVAEKFGYINTLTKIILSKTCKHVKKMVEDGYYVKRVSVNCSVQDLKSDDFCSTVENLIKSCGIPPRQIALEVTESQNEKDFEVVKKKIDELKISGIKFYLDDFGTGYSNFERIMELPFDIVKFDRSLVIASGNDERMKAMVSNLAKMFREVDYAVLYEGIENEYDEERCADMSASYLQGYKYSKPIPIERLCEYFEKESLRI